MEGSLSLTTMVTGLTGEYIVDVKDVAVDAGQVEAVSVSVGSLLLRASFWIHCDGNNEVVFPVFLFGCWICCCDSSRIVVMLFVSMLLVQLMLHFLPWFYWVSVSHRLHK